MTNLGFWGKLPRPFFALAPMANVTDVVFRDIIAECGKPDVFYTEFVSVDGLLSAGREALLVDLRYTPAQRPIVAQVFGAKPDSFVRCAELIRSLGFDGLDINMGCPDRNVEKQGAGAALMKNPKLAREILRAAKAGAGGLPISIKTRIGYRDNTLHTWLPELLAEAPAAIIIHARTRQEMSKVEAHWEAVAEAVSIARGSGTLLIGNGDVKDLPDARRLAGETGADGIMLGRAIFGNPWLFNVERAGKPATVTERLRTMAEHSRRFEESFAGIKNFSIMKKHYQAYATGFDGAKELRVKLMAATNAREVAEVVETFLAQRE